MRIKIVVGLGLALILALAGRTYYRYDCGESQEKITRRKPAMWENATKRTKTTEVPERNWKGQCIVTVTIETTFYTDPPTTDRTVTVWRVKPGPITLLP